MIVVSNALMSRMCTSGEWWFEGGSLLPQSLQWGGRRKPIEPRPASDLIHDPIFFVPYWQAHGPGGHSIHTIAMTLHFLFVAWFCVSISSAIKYCSAEVGWIKKRNAYIEFDNFD